MANNSLEMWLWLLLVMKPHNMKTNFILSKCQYNVETACRQIRDGKLPFLSDDEKRRAEDVRLKSVRELMRLCGENSVRIITLDDEEYPEVLRNVENPPIVLFTAGSLEQLNSRLTIAAVGTRNISEYGLKAADYICGGLARSGVNIISGLAVGGDAAAHKACLAAGGRTVGVLGCGILVNYPAENAKLKREMVEHGGAVVSELLPNTKSSAGYFNIRNRIIAGMSHGTLVLEASERSGSLLTAGHAVEQGREVFCIPPHDILSPRFAGASFLIRNGAVPVFCPTDITDAFGISSFNDNAAVVVIDAANGKPVEYSASKARKRTDKADEEKPENEENERKTDNSEALENLSPNEAAVMKLLFEKPADIDTLVENVGADYSEMTEILTNLELYGFITLSPDGFYTIL